MKPRTRRPYEQNRVSKSSALIFGVGLLALFITLLIGVSFTVPAINRRLENLPYYARTYYRKLVPHPEYLPTPALAADPAGETAAVAGAPVRLDAPPAVAVEPTATPTSPPPPSATPTTPPPTEAAAAEPVEAEPAPTNTPLPEPPAVELSPVAASAQIQNLTHQWQTWNNCGPATVTMNMSHFGRTETQADAALFLKPNKDDKNVNPTELAAYARTTGLQATVRQGGSLAQLKQFLSNNLPVLAETWLVHDGDGLGHYRLVTGYNDSTGQLTTFDSLNGPSFTVDYDQFDADWRVFNRTYVIIYPAEQADVVAAIIGEDASDSHLYGRLAAAAQAEIEANPQDAIAWFNRGEALTRLGQVEAAAGAFDQARRLGLHWRRLWYQFTPFEAYYAVGRYQDVLELAEATLKGTGGLEEAYYYRGLALIATGQPGAEDAFQAAIAYNSNFAPAREALAQLTGQP